MGKGDKKSKRGKIIMGSYGVRRKQRKSTLTQPVAEMKEAKAVLAEKEKPAPKVKAVKEIVVASPPEENVPGAEAVKPPKKKAPPKASAKADE